MSLIILFHQSHLSERGTSTALFDYAYYNESILGNKSIILYKHNHPISSKYMENKFNKQFKCYTYNTMGDIFDIMKQIRPDYFYTIIYGNREFPDFTIQTGFECPSLNHAVFHCEPFGDKYAMVSQYLSNKFGRRARAVNHIVSFLEKDLTTENLRVQLNIPEDAVVFGRYGGKETFNIHYVKEIIIQLLYMRSNYYFLFMNTAIFINHPRVIHLEQNVEFDYKIKFINTCNALLTARTDGETFGLTIGEFAIMNKPIITNIGQDTSHIDILGDKAYIYRNKEEFLSIMIGTDFTRDDTKKAKDYFSYYSPENIMKEFEEEFLNVGIFPLKYYSNKELVERNFKFYTNDLSMNIKKKEKDGYHCLFDYRNTTCSTNLFYTGYDLTGSVIIVGCHIGISTFILYNEFIDKYGKDNIYPDIISIDNNKFNCRLTSFNCPSAKVLLNEVTDEKGKYKSTVNSKYLSNNLFDYSQIDCVKIEDIDSIDHDYIDSIRLDDLDEGKRISLIIIEKKHNHDKIIKSGMNIIKKYKPQIMFRHKPTIELDGLIDICDGYLLQ